MERYCDFIQCYEMQDCDLFTAEEDYAIEKDYDPDSQTYFTSFEVDLTPIARLDVIDTLMYIHPALFKEGVKNTYDMGDISVVVESQDKDGEISPKDIYLEVHNMKTDQHEKIPLTEKAKERVKQNLESEGDRFKEVYKGITVEDKKVLKILQEIERDIKNSDLVEMTRNMLLQIERGSAEVRRDISDSVRESIQKAPRDTAPTTDEVIEDVAEQAFDKFEKSAEALKRAEDIARKIQANLEASDKNEARSKEIMFSDHIRKVGRTIVDSAKSVIDLTGVIKFVPKLVEKLKETKASEFISDLIHHSKSKEIDNVRKYGYDAALNARNISAQIEDMKKAFDPANKAHKSIIDECDRLIALGNKAGDPSTDYVSIKDYNAFIKSVRNFIEGKNDGPLFFQMPDEITDHIAKIKKSLNPKKLEKERKNLSKETRQMLDEKGTIKDIVDRIENSYQKPKIEITQNPKRERKLERERKREKRLNLEFSNPEINAINDAVDIINASLSRIIMSQKTLTGSKGYDRELVSRCENLLEMAKNFQGGKEASAIGYKSYCCKVAGILENGTNTVAAQYSPIVQNMIRTEFANMRNAVDKILEPVEKELEKRFPKDEREHARPRGKKPDIKLPALD